MSYIQVANLTNRDKIKLLLLLQENNHTILNQHDPVIPKTAILLPKYHSS